MNRRWLRSTAVWEMVLWQEKEGDRLIVLYAVTIKMDQLRQHIGMVQQIFGELGMLIIILQNSLLNNTTLN